MITATSRNTVPSGAQHVLTAPGQRAVLVEVGGGVRAYESGGLAVLAGYRAEQLRPRFAGALLAPWPNRVAGGRYVVAGRTEQLAVTEPELGTALHGLVCWSRWQPSRVAADAVTLTCDPPPQAGYPYALHLQTTWSLDPAGLRADSRAVNVGQEPAPFGFGAHPYLGLAGGALADAVLEVPAARRLLVDDRQVPVAEELLEGTGYDLRAGRALGALRLDTTFAGLARDADGMARVRLRSGGLASELWCDAAFDWLQLFTVEDFAGGSAAIAVEPMSCAPDAFNSGAGLVTLAPGAEWRGSWGVRAGSP